MIVVSVQEEKNVTKDILMSLLTLFILISSICTPTKDVMASDQEYGNWGKPFGAELWDCRMNVNVSMRDLNRALDEYGSLIEEQGLKEYKAAIWTPIYATMPNVERSVFWSGYWPLEADGKAIDALQSNYSKISKILDPVITCRSKVYYWGWHLFNGLETDPESNRIVNVQHCSYKTEWDNLRGQLNAKTDSDLLAANKKLRAHLEKHDLVDVNSYQLWPNSGFSFADPMDRYDFIWITEYKNFTHLSERMRRLIYEYDYWNLYSDLLLPLIDCDTQQSFRSRKITGTSST